MAVKSPRIVLVHMMRSASERLPGKLLRPLDDKPLCQWAMETAKAATNMSGADYRIGLWPGEIELGDIAANYGVAVLQRTERSMFGESAAELWDRVMVHQLRHWDWVVGVNPCMPFVSLLWHNNLIDRIRKADGTKPVIAVFERRETVWDADCRPICGGGEWNTKTQPLYYAPAHWCIAWPRHIVGRYDAGFEFMVVPRNWQFLCDIDTEDDWKMAEALAAFYSQT